jgi:hypothetical protein
MKEDGMSEDRKADNAGSIFISDAGDRDRPFGG